MTERKRLEEQLRQSQKMEAVGRLAGGIAHDFNNLLTVIGGYTETALAELPKHASTAALLREVRRAAESAASLTRRLLMFSRREIVRLSPLDLNAVVSDVEQLLKRTLGEDIDIVTSLPCGVQPIQGGRDSTPPGVDEPGRQCARRDAARRHSAAWPRRDARERYRLRHE